MHKPYSVIVAVVLIIAVVAGAAAGVLIYTSQGDSPAGTGASEQPATSNSPEAAVVDQDQMLLVLSAPSVNDDYYQPAFNQIVQFQIDYAKQIQGRDNVVVLVDADTRSFYEGDLPASMLIAADVIDIWMRDFTLANPQDAVQFVYSDASLSASDAVQVQDSFAAFADQNDIKRRQSDLVLDGGNIVDNYAGDIITTTRFLEDNGLDVAAGKAALAAAYGADRVAILPPDEDVLAHSDGMVMWLDDQTLLVNDYSDIDATLRTTVLDELRATFSDVTIIEVPVVYQENAPGEWVGFSSACGVNLNSVLTNNYIYVPTFGMDHDGQVLDIIRANTDKEVVPIDARDVCAMGGSVRCLTLQLSGANAETLIDRARQ